MTRDELVPNTANDKLMNYGYHGKKLYALIEGFLYAEILLKIMLFKTDDPLFNNSIDITHLIELTPNNKYVLILMND